MKCKKYLKWFPKPKWLKKFLLFRAVLDANIEGCGQVWSVLLFQAHRLITWGFTRTKLLQSCSSCSSSSAVALIWAFLWRRSFDTAACKRFPPASVQTWTHKTGVYHNSSPYSYTDFGGYRIYEIKYHNFMIFRPRKDLDAAIVANWLWFCFGFVCSWSFICLECHTRLKLSWV